jgi:hypothetical protein
MPGEEVQGPEAARETEVQAGRRAAWGGTSPKLPKRFPLALVPVRRSCSGKLIMRPVCATLGI